MGGISTFGTYTMARLGIYVSQQALNVTGNNISNINTDGYTRQRVDQSSMYLDGSDRYVSMIDNRMGCGAIVKSIDQIRDPYLDIRYRNEMSNVGYMDSKLDGLGQIASILDEVGRGEEDFGVLEAQFNDLIGQMEDLAGEGAGKDQYDTLVRTSASALCDLFNNYANRLETLRKNEEMTFKDNIDKVNDILVQIRDLNRSIRKANIHGNNALEQRDQRNLLIDQLSEYVPISVTYEMENLGAGVQVEKLVIKLNGNDKKNPDANEATLVNGLYATQLDAGHYEDEHGVVIPEGTDNSRWVFNKNYGITLEPLKDHNDKVMPLSRDTTLSADTITGTDANTTQVQADEALAKMIKNDPGKFPNKMGETESYTYAAVQNKDDGSWKVETTTVHYSDEVALHDNTLYGRLQAQREMLMESGEYATTDMMKADPNAASKRGIPYYQHTLDTLAHEFAKAMNEANMYDPTKLPAGTTDDPEKYVLFSNDGNGNDPEKITAANISISKNWSDEVTRIRQSKDPNHTSTDNTNLTHILAVLQGDHEFKATATGEDKPAIETVNQGVFFTGSFQEFYSNHVTATLAHDQQTTTVLLDNYTTSADELYVNRDSVSGVDLNDEAMNMMQFEQSYSAACRLMTTIDTMLDKLVNGTAV